MTSAVARTHWAVKVWGKPIPKGSMRCVGGKGGRHQLLNNDPETDKWQARIKGAGERLGITEPLTGPIGAQLTFTVDRPKTVSLASRPWPHEGKNGDTDKLARCVLDGLEQAGVYGNDAQVVELTTKKVYPDTPDVVDRLERSGVFIRIYLI